MLSRRSHGDDVDDDGDDDDHEGGDEFVVVVVVVVVVVDDGDGAATHYDLEPSCLVGGLDVSTTKNSPQSYLHWNEIHSGLRNRGLAHSVSHTSVVEPMPRKPMIFVLSTLYLE